MKVRWALPGGLVLATALAVLLVAWHTEAQSTPAPDQQARSTASGAAWLSMLPDGETKRRFILDCTGCHVWTEDWVRAADGSRRDAGAWATSIRKMVGMFGQGTGFPIISSWPDADALGMWLEEAWRGEPDAARSSVPASLLPTSPPQITEYPIPVPMDLPHDLMVAADGEVLITGMFTHQVYRLDPATGTFSTTAIPVPNANPRALDLDAQGRWLLLLGGPGAITRYDPGADAWETARFGAYPHSIRVAPDGRVWWNGHFTAEPEVIGAWNPATGTIDRFTVPPRPTADSPAGESTIPYGLRVAPDGIVWATQLRGGHLIRLDPATGDIRQYKMPSAHAGPRRPDVAPDGMIWIPAYSAGKLARFDPRTETFREWDLPVRDALPYIVRVDQSNGTVWIGTGHGDVMVSFDPTQERFTVYSLPTRGALIRHIDIDEERGEVWAAYGASPGIPSKVARIRPAR